MLVIDASDAAVRRSENEEANADCESVVWKLSSACKLNWRTCFRIPSSTSEGKSLSRTSSVNLLNSFCFLLVFVLFPSIGWWLSIGFNTATSTKGKCLSRWVSFCGAFPLSETFFASVRLTSAFRMKSSSLWPLAMTMPKVWFWALVGDGSSTCSWDEWWGVVVGFFTNLGTPLRITNEKSRSCSSDSWTPSDWGRFWIRKNCRSCSSVSSKEEFLVWGNKPLELPR